MKSFVYSRGIKYRICEVRYKYSSNGCFTFVEILVCIALLSVLLAVLWRVFGVFWSKKAQNLTKQLILQMEARKAVMSLYQNLHQAVEVIMPKPGSTMPSLVYKDVYGNYCCLYLEEDPKMSLEENTNVYKLMLVTKDPLNNTIQGPSKIMELIKQINFTSYSGSGVLITATLTSGGKNFSFIDFVKLKNSETEN